MVGLVAKLQGQSLGTAGSNKRGVSARGMGSAGAGAGRIPPSISFSTQGIRFHLRASMRKPGKFDGIPCAVHEVSRLESQWYTVHFYTNEYWDRCK